MSMPAFGVRDRRKLCPPRATFLSSAMPTRLTDRRGDVGSRFVQHAHIFFAEPPDACG